MYKLLSSCTGYMLQPKLTFLIHDIAVARRLSAAIKVSEARGFSADKVNSVLISARTRRAREKEVPAKGHTDNPIFDACKEAELNGITNPPLWRR